jgi:hypothetical protein
MIAKINYHIYACAELILRLVRAADDHRSIARQCRSADEAQARNCPPARADATRDLSTMYRLIDRTGRTRLVPIPTKSLLPTAVVHKDMIRVRDFSLQHISVVVPPFPFNRAISSDRWLTRRRGTAGSGRMSCGTRMHPLWQATQTISHCRKTVAEPIGLVELVLFYANVLPGSATMSHIRMTTSRTRTGRRHRGDISSR